MDGYRCWKLHRAVALHLTTEKYCIITSRANTKHTSEDRYRASREQYIFENIARHIHTPNEALNFFISNFVYSGSDQAFDSLRSWDNYSRWCKEKESMTQLILDDIDSFKSSDLSGYPPALLSQVISGAKLPQTAVVLNRVTPFLDRWIQEDHFTFTKRCIMLKKLDPFVKCNMNKIKESLVEVCDDLLLLNSVV